MSKIGPADAPPEAGSGADGTRCALVAGHPGHELRVYGWLERTRPLVVVLTDGSGRGGAARVASSAALIDAAGAKRGTVFGRLPDAAAYEALLDGDVAVFVGLAEEIAEELVAEGVEALACDAVEGFNPTHDLCHEIAAAAARLAAAELGRPVRCYDFLLDAAPDTAAAGRPRDADWRVVLDEGAFGRKLAAASRYVALREEVAHAFAAHGVDAFRVERLRAFDPACPFPAAPAGKPVFERYGEWKVATGHYARVLRYRDHLLPAAEALRKRVEAGD